MEIIFILGTKAQYIKTIPMINHALEKNLRVRLIDLKQHPEKTKTLIKKIKGNYEYISFIDNDHDLGTYSDLIRWFLKCLFKIVTLKYKKMNNSYCVVHGDTLSTLIGGLLTRKNKGKLVLLEAGLAFPGLFKHFPESFIRYFVAKLSHFMIANGREQIDQLKAWNVKGKILEISRNTIYDSLDLVNLKKDNTNKKVVISIHRTENINSKQNMEELVNILSNIDSEFQQTWYLHIPTKNKLSSFNLISKLESIGINLENLLSYEDFLSSIYNSDFVVTDGDGVTEECYILGIPTLVWRHEHLDSNHLFEGKTSLLLSEFDIKKSNKFFKDYKSYRTERHSGNVSPSLEALNKLIENI